MTRRIAVTGHSDLSDEATTPVYAALLEHLSTRATASLVGISCLARGADSLFASAVLARGGALEVVLPCSTYREQKVRADHLPQFDELLANAAEVRVMPYTEAGREAYEAANEALLAAADELYAVWDGQPSQRSGTGTVVAAAEQRGLPVSIIWPPGAARR